MTKEEILYKHFDEADVMYFKGKYIDDYDVEPIIFKAMDEWADIKSKEIAIGFLDWAEETYSVQYEGFNINRFNNGQPPTVWVSRGEEKTLEQLFNTYINTLQHG